MSYYYAANRVTLCDGKVLTPGVVEIAHDDVVHTYALDREQPFTEWLGGTIDVVNLDGNRLAAFHNGVRLKSEKE